MGWSNQGAGEPAADNGASASLFCDSVGSTLAIGPVGTWRKNEVGAQGRCSAWRRLWHEGRRGQSSRPRSRWRMEASILLECIGFVVICDVSKLACRLRA